MTSSSKNNTGLVIAVLVCLALFITAIVLISKSKSKTPPAAKMMQRYTPQQRYNPSQNQMVRRNNFQPRFKENFCCYDPTSNFSGTVPLSPSTAVCTQLADGTSLTSVIPCWLGINWDTNEEMIIGMSWRAGYLQDDERALRNNDGTTIGFDIGQQITKQIYDKQQYQVTKSTIVSTCFSTSNQSNPPPPYNPNPNNLKACKKSSIFKMGTGQKVAFNQFLTGKAASYPNALQYLLNPPAISTSEVSTNTNVTKVKTVLDIKANMTFDEGMSSVKTDAQYKNTEDDSDTTKTASVLLNFYNPTGAITTGSHIGRIVQEYVTDEFITDFLAIAGCGVDSNGNQVPADPGNSMLYGVPGGERLAAYGHLRDNLREFQNKDLYPNYPSYQAADAFATNAPIKTEIGQDYFTPYMSFMDKWGSHVITSVEYGAAININMTFASDDMTKISNILAHIGIQSTSKSVLNPVKELQPSAAGGGSVDFTSDSTFQSIKTNSTCTVNQVGSSNVGVLADASTVVDLTQTLNSLGNGTWATAISAYLTPPHPTDTVNAWAANYNTPAKYTSTPVWEILDSFISNYQEDITFSAYNFIPGTADVPAVQGPPYIPEKPATTGFGVLGSNQFYTTTPIDQAYINYVVRCDGKIDYSREGQTWDKVNNKYVPFTISDTRIIIITQTLQGTLITLDAPLIGDLTTSDIITIKTSFLSDATKQTLRTFNTGMICPPFPASLIPGCYVWGADWWNMMTRSLHMSFLDIQSIAKQADIYLGPEYKVNRPGLAASSSYTTQAIGQIGGWDIINIQNMYMTTNMNRAPGWANGDPTGATRAVETHIVPQNINGEHNFLNNSELRGELDYWDDYVMNNAYNYTDNNAIYGPGGFWSYMCRTRAGFLIKYAAETKSSFTGWGSDVDAYYYNLPSGTDYRERFYDDRIAPPSSATIAGNDMRGGSIYFIDPKRLNFGVYNIEMYSNTYGGQWSSTCTPGSPGGTPAQPGGTRPVIQYDNSPNTGDTTSCMPCTSDASCASLFSDTNTFNNDKSSGFIQRYVYTDTSQIDPLGDGSGVTQTGLQTNKGAQPLTWAAMRNGCTATTDNNGSINSAIICGYKEWGGNYNPQQINLNNSTYVGRKVPPLNMIPSIAGTNRYSHVCTIDWGAYGPDGETCVDTPDPGKYEYETSNNIAAPSFIARLSIFPIWTGPHAPLPTYCAGCITSW